MALLNEKFENTTTVIGVNNGTENKWIGTGFFVSFKNKVGNGSYIYLVTNRHVINNYSSIVIRTHLKNGNIVPLSVNLYENGEKLFLCHGNNNIDIAVIQLNGKYVDDVLDKINTFDIEKNTFMANEYLYNGGFEGSPVLMLGFPMGIIDNYSTTPICRRGCIARFKLDEIKNNYSFLLDLQNYPGNSGSPIISCPEIIGVEGTKILSEARLIGIVYGYLPYRESLVNTQTNEVVEIKTENSGIAVAHPTDYIRELIEMDLKNKKMI